MLSARLIARGWRNMVLTDWRSLSHHSRSSNIDLRGKCSLPFLAREKHVPRYPRPADLPSRVRYLYPSWQPAALLIATVIAAWTLLTTASRSRRWNISEWSVNIIDCYFNIWRPSSTFKMVQQYRQDIIIVRGSLSVYLFSTGSVATCHVGVHDNFSWFCPLQVATASLLKVEVHISCTDRKN